MSFLDAYIPEQMALAHVPGLIITVIQGEEVLVSKGYGFADLDNQAPMTPQTVIRAGSVSKSVTASAVIKLVEQGVLNLDAAVSDYIPDLKLDDEHGPASTIRQLLNHTSGYSDNLLLSHSPDQAGWAPLDQVLREDLPPRAFPPGRVSAYSDWNFSLLGYAIEGATGLPYEQVIAELIFNPLEMAYSTYQQPIPDELFTNLAVGYGWNYSKVRYDVVPHDFVRMSPGIAMVTTGEDMGVYMQMLLNDGRFKEQKVFGDQALASLLTRQNAAHPYSRGNTYAFTELTISGRKVLYKDGNGIGFASRLILMPEQDLGIFISTNHRNLGEGLWLSQAASMATRLLPTEILERFVPESELDIPAVQPLLNRVDQLERFTGHYQKAGVSRNDFFKLEGLLDNVDVRDNGNGTLRIGSGSYVEVEPLVFQNLDSPGFFVIFVANPAGEVEFLTFGGTGSYQKAPGYQAKNFQITLLVIVILISLSMAILWPIRRPGHWVVWLLSLLNLVFIVGVGMLFIPSITDLLIFFKTVPISVQVLFSLPWIVGLLTLVLLILLGLRWKDPQFSTGGKIHIGLLAGSSVIVVWMANFWNLVLK